MDAPKMIQLRPLQLADFLAEAIPAREPVLITGAPGIGKSDIVGQATTRAGAQMILSHPAVADPTDAKGFPFPHPDGTHATFLPFGDLKRALDAGVTPTVWCLDDFGQAPPAVQASYMQLLLARRVNGHVLPDSVTFISMTNRREDRAGVSGMLEPVKSRFSTIVELIVSIDDWSAWAIDAGVPPELIAFLRFRPDLLSAFEPSADMVNCPSPRTWANAGRLLALDLSDAVRAAVLAGAVGEGAAVELLAFLRLYASLPSIDGILLDPDAADIPTAPGTLYAVVTALGMRATAQNFGRVARYAERLNAGGSGEFAALLVRDTFRRDTSLVSTPDGIRLMTGEVGALINGTPTN